MKVYEHRSVLVAARDRIAKAIDAFPRFYVSFSGGKDSGVLLNLVIDEARVRGRLPVDVLVVDLEAQYQHTIDYVARTLDRPEVRGHWVCTQLHLRNAVSQHQPHWICWDEEKPDAWVRAMPDRPDVVTAYPWARRGMEFEEFTPLWGEHFGGGEPTVCFVGIRSDESLNRFRTINSRDKARWDDHHWTTRLSESLVNAYPIYDWRTEDVWTANGRFGWDYNRIYDLMHLAGVSIHEQRLCQPYGDDQRRGLWLFKILEPETWARVVARVEGANFGNRYAGSKAIGHLRVEKPPGHTWESYARFLLDTMPPHASAHYWSKIRVFIAWYEKETGASTIPDEADPKLEAARKAPSWRRIVKVLLKNDWWCKGLSFSQTRREMERQAKVITRYMDL